MSNQTGEKVGGRPGGLAATLSPEQLALLKRRLKRKQEAERDRRIERRGLQVAPLSFAQELLWLVDQLSPDKVNYTVPRLMRLRGPFNVEAMERTLTRIVERHEVVRTAIRVVGGVPMQHVQPAGPVSIARIDVSAEPAESREARALEIVRELIRRPFDLSKDVLMRPTVIRLDAEDHVFVLESHHIASDGWSKDVLFTELNALYAAYCEGREAVLPELPIQYSDYAVWQREVLTETFLKDELTFWKKQVAGAPPVLEFPSARQRPAVQSFEGRGQRFHFPKALLDAAQQFSKDEGVTLFMTLLAAFNAFVCRYTGQQDFVIGTPIAGRTRPEQEPLIGYFTNTLALRGNVTGDPTFRELVRRVRQTSLSAYEHQELPFELLVKELRPDRTLSYSPVFQVMFSVGHAVQTAPRLYQLEASPLFVERGTSRFDLLFGATALPDGLALACEYNTDLFADDAIKQMVDCLATLLSAALEHPDRRVSELPLLTAAEAERQVVDWNDTAQPFPQACIHTLFEAQVDRTPGGIAVEDDRETLTYDELDARANRIAHWLLAEGATVESRVGICMHRSVGFAAALLGILKAGCAAVLLDPSLPSGRLDQIAADAGVLRVVTEERLRQRFSSETPVACIDTIAAIQQQPSARPRLPLAPNNLAFVIYTSGSTGTPKGVLLEHRGLVNHHVAVANAFGLTDADRVLQFALLGFDICLEELFPSWLTGAAVVFRSETIAGREFVDWLDRRRITVMDVPTAFWHEWVHDLKSLNAKPPASLRLLIVGGERASRQVLTVWQGIVGPDVRWLNTYGPTEASVIATLHEPPYDPEGRDTSEIPIGKPIANVQVYVLDAQMRPVPAGVPGELYIGGAGLARGYLHRPEETTSRFVPSPFGASALLYRTGDLAKHRADGSVEFVGRSDDQVKIRGFRVEPGEVSAALSKEPGVFQSFVLASPGPQARLIAYIVPERGQPVNADALRAALQQRFPAYMVPSAFVVLDELPLTPQGKVNRQALPMPEVTVPVTSAPQAAHERAPLEAMLIDIWEQVLEQRPIGRRDDFFDLGGHSLVAVRLLAQVRQRLGVDLPLATMFTARTVEALADELLRAEEGRPLPTLMPIQTEGSSTPLFCVSRPNVNALGYVFLSRILGRDQRVYGLQSHLRDASREPYTQAEFEKTAAEYITAMRTVQPHGPYFLIGNCEGAHIAFEMCRQLHAQGEPIGMFAILDAWPQENTRRLYLFLLHYYMRRFRLFVEGEDRGKFLRKRVGGFLRLLYERVTTVTSKAPPKKDSADAMRERYWPGSGYQLPTWQGDALLFRVKKQPYWRIRDYKLAWDRRVLGNVEVVDVTGEHTTILREPHVRTVARHVAAKFAGVASHDAPVADTEHVTDDERRGLGLRTPLAQTSAPGASPSGRRVLMMCYLYPPILTSGTMRSVAFSRNLPRFGWTPTVLTVQNNRAGFPQTEAVPDDVTIHRVSELNLNGAANVLQGVTNRLLRLFGGELKRTVYRDWICVPDPHIGWFALPRAIRLARRADAIYTSCSPFSSAVTATFVKRLTRKPLIVDFRDAWLLNPYNSPGPRTLRYIRAAEPRVIRNCDALILNTPGATDLYKKTYPQWAHKMFCIPNGYDALNPAPVKKQRGPQFRIMHVGSFYGSRNPDLLLEALAQIGNPNIQFVHVGAPWPDFKEYEGRVNINVIPSLPHDEALDLMKDASLLYLKQGFETSVTYYIAVAAKTYEYLATGLPILSDGPESDNVAIVRKYASTSYIVTSGEVADLKRAIVKAYDEGRAVIPMVSAEFVRDFDRVTLTGHLADVLNTSVQRQLGRAPQLEASYSTQQPV